MKKHIETLAVAATLLCVALLGGVSIYANGDYGLTVFLLAPFVVGFLPNFILGFFKPLTFRRSTILGVQTLLLALVCLLLFALEGILCIVMASPLLAFSTFLGSTAAFGIHKLLNKPHPANGLALLLLSAAACISFDEAQETPHIFPVRTSVKVQAPIQQVWKNVVTFSRIPAPDGWFFKTGIAYPIDATIEGKGKGAVRYCNFTTGSFVEPITTWDEPNLLAFDVVEYPLPMEEWNPFWDIHPPHLDGHFQSHRGQFRLTQLTENETLLEGTTWYSVDIYPESYWRVWSAYIIHRIHGRVLEHIKKEAEK